MSCGTCSVVPVYDIPGFEMLLEKCHEAIRNAEAGIVQFSSNENSHRGRMRLRTKVRINACNTGRARTCIATFSSKCKMRYIFVNETSCCFVVCFVFSMSTKSSFILVLVSSVRHSCIFPRLATFSCSWFISLRSELTASPIDFTVHG